MVTTISHQKTWYELSRGTPEEREVARTAAEAVKQTVEAMTPVLKYVGHSGFVTVVNYSIYRLFLDRKGRWVISWREDSQIFETTSRNGWKQFPPAEVLSGLSTAFSKAVELKRQRLEALQVRLEEVQRFASQVREVIR